MYMCMRVYMYVHVCVVFVCCMYIHGKYLYACICVFKML